MIYKGLNRTGMIGEIKTKGGGEIAEVYGGIGESDPIYYKQREMVGTSPMQFKALGLPIKDYRIYGNTIQNGTPSPEMPVDVVGCGVKTENLWDGTANVTERIYEIEPNTEYVAGKYPPLGQQNGRIDLTIYDSDMNQLWADYAFIYYSIASPRNLSNAKYAKVSVNTSPFTSYFFGKTEYYSYNNYIPYGYKLPVTTTNGTDTVTTPIYIGSEPLHRLGEYADYVDYSSGKIVRRIKKLVLTGEERISGYGTMGQNAFEITTQDTGLPIVLTEIIWPAISDRYLITSRISFYDKKPPIPDNGYIGFGGIACVICIYDPRFTTSADFKSYLAAQYAAGTPVTVWYVLETPIEEDPPVPFPELPTFTGTNSITVDTPVKPSEIDLMGRLKTSGYGQLLDKNLTAINDSTGTPIFIRG